MPYSYFRMLKKYAPSFKPINAFILLIQIINWAIYMLQQNITAF